VLADATRHRQGRIAALFVSALVLVLFAAGLGARAWDAALLRAAAERLGPRAEQALPSLLGLLAAGQSQGDAERLASVNRWFNERIEFRPDDEVWGQEDFWATPLEALARGRGDCEDYAIAKYAALLAMGVAPQRLRLVYVRATLIGRDGRAGSQPHMVLAYDPAEAEGATGGAMSEPLILDNLRAELLPASRRGDLQPVFSFNAQGLWQGASMAAGQAAGDPLQRITRWREVWQRLLAEGLP
jgi:predicted transglutaminase-like cysteine proteinase